MDDGIHGNSEGNGLNEGDVDGAVEDKRNQTTSHYHIWNVKSEEEGE